MKLLPLLAKSFVVIALTVVASVAFAEEAHAFDPGRIIDDSVFTSSASMSVADIQNFLNSKNSACLKSYNGAGWTAGVIKQHADAFGISPKVLLVTLQKEQGLITRSDCPQWRYDTAMGFGCPDGSPCDPNYFGFERQVYQGARHFRGFYDQAPGWYIPYRPGERFIQWNPSSLCGGSYVNIANRATASLYSYTPYQPNAAALANPYGTGDSCSAYGNRNFWRDFRDWFGSTAGLDYAWQLVSVSYGGGTNQITVGETKTITVTARNTGNQSWSNTNFPIRLATWDPSNHGSALYHASWSSPIRPATLSESVVMPGENGTFTFQITSPAAPQTYYERFNLVAEGSTWLNDAGFTLVLGVTLPAHAWQPVSTSSSTGSFVLTPGSTAQITVTARNIGSATWTKDTNPVRLATWNPSYRQSGFCDASWPTIPPAGSQPTTCVRAATLNEAMVPSGMNGTFTFTIKAPSTPGSYSEAFNLVREGIAWFADPTFAIGFNVGTYSWQPTTTSPSTTVTFNPGEVKTITLSARNTGDVTWNKASNPVRLATWNPSYRQSPFYHSSWMSTTRVAEMQEASVAPGMTATFSFPVRAPLAGGSYHESFNLVMEGITWLQDAGFNLNLTVGSKFTWQMVSQSSSTGSFELTPGTSATFTLVAKNTGDVTWHNSGNPVKLATWEPTYRRSVFDPGTWESPYRAATLQEASVTPGANGTFVFNVKAPITQSFYVERFNLVMEGIAWFQDPWLEFDVLVQNRHTWQMVSQASSTGSFAIPRNSTATFTLVAKNTGNITWTNSGHPVKLATWEPTYRRSVFDPGTWESPYRAATLQEPSVAPGANGTFTFAVRAPATPGFYVERFNLVREGIAWFTDPWLEFDIVVQ